MTATAAQPAAPLLSVRNLTTIFPVERGVVRAVNDVSLEIRSGRVLGVVGESGSGKSVTARSILRTLRSPGRVESGVVEFDGRDLLDMPEASMTHLRGNEIAMIFQDPQAALNPVMRIGDQIAEALLVHGHQRREARERTLELLRQVGIPDVERTVDQYPHEFSGGMRQRVVIAIALANKPRLLIADEPTTALDVTIQAQILHLLVELREELGVAIMMITHDMGVVAELCDDLVVMYGGRVVESGPVRQVFAAPRHPYTTALLKAIPRIDAVRGELLPAIPGSPPDPAHLPSGCSFHPRCPLARADCSVTRPNLEHHEDGTASACWVTSDGSRVTTLPTPVVARHPRPEVGAEPILRVTDLRTDVAGRRGLLSRGGRPVYAVDGVSLEVHAGETLGLVGESGCGKSTLSRTVVGINSAAAGRIEVGGVDVTVMGKAQRATVAASIQYVFQDPYASLNPRRTIGQSLEEALSEGGVTGAAATRESRALLDRVGLNADHLDRYPYAFSGGQRQRVGIARALALKPRILICDEPVSALDVSIQAQIINLLEELRDDLGLGYLFIAHDLSVVRHLSDRVAVMYLGRIVETGTAVEVYGDPQHPYTAALLSSTPEPTLDQPQRERIVLTGDMPSPASPPTGCRFQTRCPVGPLHFPDRTACRTQSPALLPLGDTRGVACHFPGDLAARAAASA